MPNSRNIRSNDDTRNKTIYKLHIYIFEFRGYLIMDEFSNVLIIYYCGVTGVNYFNKMFRLYIT